MIPSLKNHWPEYLMEAFALGLFMISACTFGTVLEHPGSPVRMAVEDPMGRRIFMGLAMGLTAILNIYSPWGQQSGAHLNPSVTLTFLRLGKIRFWDALFYCLFQFLGAVVGVKIASVILGQALAERHVHYVATLPGQFGLVPAFLAEFFISFGLMTLVLVISNVRNLSRWTGVFAGILVAAYITFEAPISGMSMNPARTFGSAFSARVWHGLWIYFTAPFLGMLFAAELYLRLRGAHYVFCAKLNHHNRKRCIFNCRYQEMMQGKR
jgi:aquaporin Z